MTDAREYDYEEEVNALTRNLETLRYAAQRAYDWKCGDIAAWDAKYSEPWGNVDAEREVWEPLAEALGVTDFIPLPIWNHRGKCVHEQCGHHATDHGTDQEVDLDGRPTSPEYLVCFACLKMSDSPGVYSHDFEAPYG